MKSPSGWVRRGAPVDGRWSKNRPNAPDKNGLQRRYMRRGFNRSDLPGLAKKLIAERKAQRSAAKLGALCKWQPKDAWEVFDRVGLDRPQHFALYVGELVGSLDRELRMCFSTPPQHGKTTTTLLVLLYLLVTRPGKQHAYITYSGTQTNEKMKDFCAYMDKAQVPYQKDGQRVLCNGSSIRFTSVDGQLTGQTLNGLAVVDDAVKNAAEARSPTVRANIERFFSQSLLTREFDGLSVIVIMTRWDAQDLVGSLKKKSWPCLNLTAVCDVEDGDPLGRAYGEALWPEHHPVSQLEKVKEHDPLVFSAMYMGDPNPEGTRLFNPETVFTGELSARLVVTYGIDVAGGGSSKKSDRSCCWRLITDTVQGICIADKVVLHRGNMKDFCSLVSEMQARQPGPCWWAVGGGHEPHNVAEMLRERGIKRLSTYYARASKRARAQDVADAWNCGRLMVKQSSDIAMQDALEEVGAFTGEQRAHDDVVDALAAAWRGAQDRMGSLVGALAASTSKNAPPLSFRNDDPRSSARAYENSLTTPQTTSRGWMSPARECIR